MEALIWIRENTPKDSIVLSDRSIMDEEMRYYMYYGAFSERQMYIEGDIYFRERYVLEREELATIVEEVFLNSDEALRKSISDGIDYIIQTKWLTPDFKPNETMTELVYESDTIRVYEIK